MRAIRAWRRASAGPLAHVPPAPQIRAVSSRPPLAPPWPYVAPLALGAAASLAAGGALLGFRARPRKATLEDRPGAREKTTQPRTLKLRLVPARSSLNFEVTHFGMLVEGSFADFEGEAELELEEDVGSPPGTPSLLLSLRRLRVRARVAAASIDTGNWLRDQRMRGDFLEVERYPWMEFTCDGSVREMAGKEDGGEGDGVLISGDLTIRGISRAAELEVRDVQGLSGAEVSATVTGRLDRFDFDVLASWPSWTVGRAVPLRFRLVAAAEDGAPAAG